MRWIVIPKFKDLTGQKINNWIILEYKGLNKFSQSTWLIECDCNKHTQRIKTTSQIQQCKSCGCVNVENLYGKHFGEWEVISDPIIKNNNRVYFLCKCSCENNTIRLVRSDKLKDGTSKSCGCYSNKIKTKHGLSKDRITNIWYGMIDRCCNKNRKDYKNYGGRGIVVCDEWSDKNNYTGLKNFIEWALNNGYDDKLTIERIDVNGNYQPDNCKWITIEEQAKNKRNTIYLDVNNEIDKLIDLSNEYNISRETILKRYRKGIKDEEKLLSSNNLKNTSGVIGVSYSNSQHNWRVYIDINKKRIELGRKKTKEEAIVTRLKAELDYYGKDDAPQKHLFKQFKIIGGEFDE